MNTTQVIGTRVPLSALASGPHGRDYALVGEEIYSINGLYCDADGNFDRHGSYVKIIDVRWPVVAWGERYLGLNEDGTYRTEPKLMFRGDEDDKAVLARYGYRLLERDSEGYNLVVKEAR